ncbi:hypothetical protein [Pseudoroseomonas cervicalis]|uniref:hypothetical protein n=1 Tax=Teichococcus cervicalis TaxID=204525 RepID=UPI0022F1495D|nr:hypothetical protein [Pseudoroseomonas cervicalis]WBV42700.1 hypothetical protein PFY06_15870 [Pseudoroseomonas cervicalis]
MMPLALPEGAALPRYRPLTGPEQAKGAPWRAVEGRLRRLTAPVAGLSPLFERRLRQALHALLRQPDAAPPALEPAERYFAGHLVLQVPPCRLAWQLLDAVSDGRRVVRLGQRFLDAGDWSEAGERLERSVVHLEMAALCDPSAALQESEIYRYMLRRAAAGTPERRNGVALSSPALIDAYFTHYAALRDRLRAEGYRPRAALPREAGHALRGAAAARREAEVGVAIGPGGEMLRLLGGRHRTALAQLLGLPAMPVRVRLVHAHWLAAQMRRTGLPPHLALPTGLAQLAGG